jgi:hypothetical protein
MGGRIWSKKEIEYLQENWGSMGYKNIAKNLKRTPTAVFVKSKRLGLSGMTIVSDYITARQIGRIMNICSKTVTTTWKDKGLKIAKKNMTLNRKMWYVKFDDFMEWLENNQDIWDASRVKEFDLGTEPDWLRKKRREDKNKHYKSDHWTPEEDRQLLYMFYTKQMTHKAIGQVLNRSEKGVSHRMKRLNDKRLRKVV